MVVTAEDVKAMRERTGLGLQDCRRLLERKDRARRLLTQIAAMEWNDMHGHPVRPQAIVDMLKILQEMNS